MVEGWVNSNLAYVGHFYIGDDNAGVGHSEGLHRQRHVHDSVKRQRDPARIGKGMMGVNPAFLQQHVTIDSCERHVEQSTVVQLT